MPLDSRAHYRSLDGLRALAVTAVLVYHVGECWQQPLQETGVGNALYRLSDLGYAGVDLFFVLSGFLITGILIDTRGHDGYFRSFYVRRTLRIFPLYYVFLAFMISVAALGYEQLEGAHAFLEELPWYGLYATNLKFMRDNYTPFLPVQHLWSLAIEEQFYLVWPAVVALVAPRRLLAWSALSVLAVWILRAVWVHQGVNPVSIYVGTPTRLDGLLLGACLAIAKHQRFEIERAAPYLTAIGAVALGVLLALLHGLSAGDAPVQTFGFAALAVLFTGVVAQCTRSRPALELPLLQSVGKLSYGIYLFHWPVVLGCYRLITTYVRAGVPGFVLNVVLSAVVTYALAALSYRVLEAPLLALKSRYPQPITNPRSPHPR